MAVVCDPCRQILGRGNGFNNHRVSRGPLGRTPVVELFFLFFFHRVLLDAPCLSHSVSPPPPIIPAMAAIKTNGAPLPDGAVVDNGLYNASTSAAPLAISEALAHLATYKTGDGLSMSEMVDSKANGGLTYNGMYATLP